MTLCFVLHIWQHFQSETFSECTKSMFNFILNRWAWMWQHFLVLVVVLYVLCQKSHAYFCHAFFLYIYSIIGPFYYHCMKTNKSYLCFTATSVHFSMETHFSNEPRLCKILLWNISNPVMKSTSQDLYFCYEYFNILIDALSTKHMILWCLSFLFPPAKSWYAFQRYEKYNYCLERIISKVTPITI